VISAEEVAGWMERLYVAAPGATLRREDRRKAVEVAGMLEEVRRQVAGSAAGQPFVLLDAAAGKGYVGLLAAKLVLEPANRRDARVITLEREGDRVALTSDVARALQTSVAIDVRQAELGPSVPGSWPAAVQLVTALHACGPAADASIDATIEKRARALLLVPCCTGRAVGATTIAESRAGELGIPRQAGVRRRFVQAIVDAERTLRLEAAGWQTEVMELCPPTISPHNLLWRARHVGEPGRMARAAADREKLIR
jgi:Methyltransferase domain